MPQRELVQWKAYYEVEPWGNEVEDLRAGMIASPLLNAWTTKGRRAKPSDWVMDFEQLIDEQEELTGESEEQRNKRIKATLLGLGKCLNRKSQRNKKKA